MDYTGLIDALIETLQRLKGDALWKMGDYIVQAVEEGQRLEVEGLLEELREFHRAVQAMAETEE